MIREALEAAKAQLIATLHVLDVAMEALDAREGTCRHEQKVDIRTQASPTRWYCPACKEQFDEPEILT